VKEAQDAPPLGVSMLIFDELQPLPSYSGTLLRYDAERDRVIRAFLESFSETTVALDKLDFSLAGPGSSKE